MNKPKILIFYILFILLILPNLGKSMEISRDENFLQILESELSKTKTQLSDFAITLTLQVDGRVRFKVEEMTKIISNKTDDNLLFRYVLSNEEKYSDLELFDFINGKKREFNEVTKLDMDNCDGNYIINLSKNEILGCKKFREENEFKLELNTIINPEEYLQECQKLPEYRGTVFKKIRFLIPAKDYSYNFVLKEFVDSELILKRPEEMNTTLSLDKKIIPITENGLNGFKWEGIIHPVPEEHIEITSNMIGKIRSLVNIQKKYSVLSYLSLLLLISMITLSVLYRIRKRAYRDRKSIGKFNDILMGSSITLIIINGISIYFEDKILLEYLSTLDLLKPIIIVLFGIVSSIFIMHTKIRRKTSYS